MGPLKWVLIVYGTAVALIPMVIYGTVGLEAMIENGWGGLQWLVSWPHFIICWVASIAMPMVLGYTVGRGPQPPTKRFSQKSIWDYIPHESED